MCFINECGWCAEINEEADEIALEKTRCNECDRIIPSGDFMHTIHQQEFEECQACANGECDCHEVDDSCCQCEEPDYGETFDYVRCLQCDRFLKAVEAAEIKAGCSINEARPLMPRMIEDISDGGRQEARKYFKMARVMFPELVASGYLGDLWRRMF